ncbi:hypothetical protein WR25_05223 [Diploscapter pachys]|uniref:Uncharacterized protein n=1 Tax=Diploscapter pachys TaxID=2018661 RepID=A0A2A2LPZ7_9BILA|nr:hypothetical protein WR25_05223 [Diploscapter pachys]
MHFRVRWRDKSANYANYFTLVIGLAFIHGGREADAANTLAAQQQFQCSSDPITHRPIETFLLRSTSTFEKPCSCLSDWNQQFCNQTNAKIDIMTINDLPTVCICRKFNDNGSKCQQFISRCYKKSNSDCACCFNQPKDWCNHLKCRNNEPDFGDSNTTCICHHNPVDYPIQICKPLPDTPRDSRNPNPAPPSVLSYRRHHHIDKPQSFKIFGQPITSEIFMYIIGSLLVSLTLLTIVMIIVGNRKIKRRRSLRERERNGAQQILLMQRVDDDRYLPSA